MVESCARPLVHDPGTMSTWEGRARASYQQGLHFTRGAVGPRGSECGMTHGICAREPFCLSACSLQHTVREKSVCVCVSVCPTLVWHDTLKHNIPPFLPGYKTFYKGDSYETHHFRTLLHFDFPLFGFFVFIWASKGRVNTHTHTHGHTSIWHWHTLHPLVWHAKNHNTPCPFRPPTPPLGSFPPLLLGRERRKQAFFPMRVKSEVSPCFEQHKGWAAVRLERELKDRMDGLGGGGVRFMHDAGSCGRGMSITAYIRRVFFSCASELSCLGWLS